MNLTELTNKVLSGKQITKAEALFLYGQPLSELCSFADKIRQHFCSNQFDICTIINAKSGSCSENCKFCAQSAHSSSDTVIYPLLDKETIVSQAKKNHDQGVLRYSIVTSGKRLSDAEVDKMCETVREIKNKVGISVCVSFCAVGILAYRLGESDASSVRGRKLFGEKGKIIEQDAMDSFYDMNLSRKGSFGAKI